MERDVFGLTANGMERRIKTERQHVAILSKVFIKLVEQIKDTHEPDGWQRLVLFSNTNELLKNYSPSLRTTLLFYLRRHPNIIAKLSNKEKSSANQTIKPFLYKWVEADEKIALGMRSIYFKNISEELLKYIEENAQTDYVNFVEILTVLEVFTSTRKEKWNEISTFDIVLFSGVPVENTRAALNELLRMRLLVFVG